MPVLFSVASLCPCNFLCSCLTSTRVLVCNCKGQVRNWRSLAAHLLNSKLNFQLQWLCSKPKPRPPSFFFPMQPVLRMESIGLLDIKTTFSKAFQMISVKIHIVPKHKVVVFGVGVEPKLARFCVFSKTALDRRTCRSYQRHFFILSVLSASIIIVRTHVTQTAIRYTVIPRLTKIIRSGITFVSRNTHTDGKDKLLEWPDRSCLLLC